MIKRIEGTALAWMAPGEVSIHPLDQPEDAKR
jgi:hypothetical protein